MLNKITHQKGILVFAMALLLLPSCNRKADLEVNESILCDLEEIADDDRYFNSNTHPGKYFTGVQHITDSIARSGNNSIHLKKGRAYGLNYNIKNSRPDQYYEVSVWRRGPKNTGHLIVSDDYSKVFYRVTSSGDSTDQDGWTKLSLSFYVPPSIQNEDIKIYVWNPDDEDVFFDDMVITRRSSETYPSYTGISSIDIFIDTLQETKLIKKRAEAFRKGILETEDNDWVDGILFIKQEIYHADVRLKGDWLDHLLGNKWSFRIKLDKSQTWNGIRTFSIQNPRSRDFINEWLLHFFCEEEDILTTRYGFIPMNFKKRSRGIYAWEEHFEKHLVESKSRREGPIVKLNEDAFWKILQLNKTEEIQYLLPVIASAEIMPFKIKRTSEDPVLVNQYIIAQDLYFQYKNASNITSEIFDVEKMAKYMAMIDLFGTYHGITWHNQRFYYNPVLSKLEPIAFDNFSEKGAVRYVKTSILGNYYMDVKQGNESSLMLANIFRDSLFNKEYIQYLKKYSDSLFVKEILSRAQQDILYFDSLISIEYSDYAYDDKYILNNAQRIREELPAFETKVKRLLPSPLFLHNMPQEITQHNNKELPPHFIKAYTDKKGDSANRIRVENYYDKDIVILGTSKKNKRLRNMLYPELKVNAYSNRNFGLAYFDSDTLSNFLYFMLEGDMTTFSIPIRPWRSPGEETPLQVMKTTFAENYLNYFQEDGAGRLILNDGYHEISKPVIIPGGYTVVIKGGSTINLIEHAPFISYSRIEIIGTAENPVNIKSTDGTGNGFTVLQAQERSVVKHTVFDHLNTLDSDGWTLTGAVTFYESDVSFLHTSFGNNMCEDGLNIIRSDFLLDECKLINTFADALDVDFGTGEIINSEFLYLNNDAIDVSGSTVSIKNCEISNSNDKGISGGENSTVSISDTRVSSSVIGIASKDHSQLTLINSEINNCRYGLVVFRKKPEFGPAYIKADNLSFSEVLTTYLVEEGSTCIVDDKIIDSNQTDVSELIYN